PNWLGDGDPAQLAASWQAAGADYISLGPVQLGHADEWVTRIPALFAASDVLFATIEIADGNGRLSPHRCQQTAQIMQQVSTLLDNGFGNLYLAAIANCPPGSPFFPVAYHAGGPPRFALAVEAADLAVTAFANARSLAEARANLVQAIEQTAADLTETAVTLAHQHHIEFGGIDFSLAPFPVDEKSLGGAMEALGLPHVGASGSLFTAAFITEAIARADFPRCGFSGLMLPVLEDSVLARRAAEGTLAITDLLAYSAVCGVGLDTIPLPGDVDAGTLTGILLDVAALATRLDKPLTARLMPLPGLQAGDPVQFDFPYFANSRVMAVNGGALEEMMMDSATVKMAAINSQQSTANSQP
ncbi:MAG: DUF711 family protein, partial [Anaerolineae bacterium]